MIKQVRDICSECGTLTLIQNKKYWMCGDCVFKKNHEGKSKEQVYSERSEERKIGKPVKEKPDLKELKKKYNIKKVGTDPKFRCSDGTLVSQAEIKWRLQIVYEKIKESRPPMCEGSGRWDLANQLSFSHTISQARCKDIGKTELIWDPGNIELEAFEAPTSNPVMSHNIWEVAGIEKKVLLLNFKRKLKFIKEHDLDGYRKLEYQLNQIDYFNS